MANEEKQGDLDKDGHGKIEDTVDVYILQSN